MIFEQMGLPTKLNECAKNTFWRLTILENVALKSKENTVRSECLAVLLCCHWGGIRHDVKSYSQWGFNRA